MTGVFTLPRGVSADTANQSLDPLRYTSAAAEGTAGIVLKATPGRFYRGNAEILTATVYWLMIFNKATAPVNTDVPIYRQKLTPNAANLISITDMFGLACPLGIGVAISSTSGVLTLAVAADLLLFAHYK